VKHLDGIKNIPGVRVVSVIGRELDKTQEVAKQYGIGHAGTDLSESLAMKEVDAVILCTPTQMHADQTVAVAVGRQARAGGDSAADSLAGAEAAAAAQKKAGKVAMVGHTRRFNPSHQWVHNKIKSGEFNIQQMDVQTYFFAAQHERARSGAIVDGPPAVASRSAYRGPVSLPAGGEIVQANAVQGPIHPALGIAMDMSIS
jgi:2-hydroxy-4-carboxymuconate semialdehyde hemiacetal dehydrogenase